LTSENYQISIGFVRSHQELKKLKSALSHIETLNIMADNLTKAARNLKCKATYTSMPQNPIDFTINGTVLILNILLDQKRHTIVSTYERTSKIQMIGRIILLIPFVGNHIISPLLNLLIQRKLSYISL
jgi:hypothetical protein